MRRFKLKISQAAKYSGLSIGAIRHYINLNLLIPEKINTKFYFTEDNLKTLKFISNLKKMGFKVKEIESIIALKTISNWVEPEDLLDYTEILMNQRERLDQSLKITEMQIHEINDELSNVSKLSKNYDIQSTGVPLKVLSNIFCPRCKRNLDFSNSQMNHKYIFNSMITCRQCGYHAQIVDGVIYTKSNPTSQYDKPDISRSIYKDIPKELVVFIKKTYNWMMPRFNDLGEGKVVLETHLNSFFFLYKHFKLLNKKNMYIIVDKFPEVISMYKKNIEYLNLDLDIVYIVNNDNLLPIKEKWIDIFVDYCSSNEHNIFNSTDLVSSIKKYLKDKGQIIGTYFSFDHNSASRKRLSDLYPQNFEKNYDFQNYMDMMLNNGFKLLTHSREGVINHTGPGTAFHFHKDGEKLYMDCVYLEKKYSG